LRDKRATYRATPSSHWVKTDSKVEPGLRTGFEISAAKKRIRWPRSTKSHAIIALALG